MHIWQQVSLADYERHMQAATVDQLGALSALLAEALRLRRPLSLALLGVAGGNGLELPEVAALVRITGYDINAEYLQASGARHGHLPLRLVQADLTEELAVEMPELHELVHVALILEHAGSEAACRQMLANACRMVGVDGALSVVLQMPSAAVDGVAQTGIASIAALASDFALVERGWLIDELGKRDLRIVWESQRAVASGKSLWLGVFARAEVEPEIECAGEDLLHWGGDCCCGDDHA